MHEQWAKDAHHFAGIEMLPSRAELCQVAFYTQMTQEYAFDGVES